MKLTREFSVAFTGKKSGFAYVFTPETADDVTFLRDVVIPDCEAQVPAFPVSHSLAVDGEGHVTGQAVIHASASETHRDYFLKVLEAANENAPGPPDRPPLPDQAEVPDTAGLKPGPAPDPAGLDKFEDLTQEPAEVPGASQGPDDPSGKPLDPSGKPVDEG